MKTGFTSQSGYCLTATGKRNNLRLISVVMKAETTEKRSSDTVNMLSYGFNTYKIDTILNKDKDLGKIKISKGKKEFGTLVLLKDATRLLKVNDEETEYKFNIKTNKVQAPLKNGDVVGSVEILDKEGNLIQTEELTIKEDIKKANFFDYLIRNIKEMCSGKSVAN